MIVAAGRSEMPWNDDGEADIAVAMSMQPDFCAQGIAVVRMRQELLKVL